MISDMSSSSASSQADEELTISVTTSRGSGEFTFSKSAKVEKVIASVAKHFNLSEDRAELLPKGESDPLKEERPLVSFGVEDGDEFVLTSGTNNV